MGKDEQDPVRAAVDALRDGFAVYRLDRAASGEIVALTLEMVNPVGAVRLGDVPWRLVGRELRDIAPGLAAAGLWDLIAGAASGSGPRRRLRVPLGDGPDAVVLEAAVDVIDVDRVVVTCRDVTQDAAGERLLAHAYEATASVRATLQTALDATTDAFAVYDVIRDEDQQIHQLRLVLINTAGASQLDQDPDALTGQELRELYPAAEASGLWQALQDAMDAQVGRTFRLHEHDPAGAWTSSWDHTIAPVGEEQVVLTWRDVTGDEQRQRALAQAGDQARHAATHDPLTGLANRALLVERLAQARQPVDLDDRIGVVYVDLDKFKQINDRLGHAAGDQLLEQVAARLTHLVRGSDTAARIGGDEFVLLLRALPADFDPDRFIQRLRHVIEQPLLLDHAAVTPRASYGVALSPPAPRDLDELLRRADACMYQDKRSHRKTTPAADD